MNWFLSPIGIWSLFAIGILVLIIAFKLFSRQDRSGYAGVAVVVVSFLVASIVWISGIGIGIYLLTQSPSFSWNVLIATILNSLPVIFSLSLLMDIKGYKLKHLFKKNK